MEGSSRSMFSSLPAYFWGNSQDGNKEKEYTVEEFEKEAEYVTQWDLTSIANGFSESDMDDLGRQENEFFMIGRPNEQQVVPFHRNNPRNLQERMEEVRRKNREAIEHRDNLPTSKAKTPSRWSLSSYFTSNSGEKEVAPKAPRVSRRGRVGEKEDPSTQLTRKERVEQIKRKKKKEERKSKGWSLSSLVPGFGRNLGEKELPRSVVIRARREPIGRELAQAPQGGFMQDFLNTGKKAKNDLDRASYWNQAAEFIGQGDRYRRHVAQQTGVSPGTVQRVLKVHDKGQKIASDVKSWFGK